jgi:hypothetical protein
VAAFPETLEESRAYIANAGYSVDEIRQISLETVGVAGTPTILLLANDGTVVHKWVGKLTDEQQKEALSVIFGGEKSS